jgi:hypothetical protein
MKANRRIRIFGSSTFLEVMAEHDELMTLAWLQLS